MSTRIGISGWRYAGWRGKFYPNGLPQRQELAYAAERFSSIELNGSFYSLQRPSSYAHWYGQVPKDFVFAVKGSRYITHMLRLGDVETAVANFFASGLFELSDKLGPILWQLPPTLRFDAEKLHRFFMLLPRDADDAAALVKKRDERVKGRASVTPPRTLRLRHALEVRHPSFAEDEAVDLLRRDEIALVVADTAGKWPLLEHITADLVYVRLHGDEKLYESGYSDDALSAWAKRIRAWQRGTPAAAARTVGAPPSRRKQRDVFVYFDNDVKVCAPFDALRLIELLSSPPDRGRSDPRRAAPRPPGSRRRSTRAS